MSGILTGTIKMAFIDWTFVSTYRRLDEHFIRQFKYAVDWHCICIYQKLSEDFIWEMRDYVDWYAVITCQKLSQDFIKKAKDYIVKLEEQKTSLSIEKVLPEEKQEENNFQFLEIEEK